MENIIKPKNMKEKARIILEALKKYIFSFNHKNYFYYQGLNEIDELEAYIENGYISDFVKDVLKSNYIKYGNTLIKFKWGKTITGV